MPCLTCGAPMGQGAVICGRCGMEHATPAPGGDMPSPGVAGREYRAEGSGWQSGLIFYATIALLLLGVAGGLGWLWWNQAQRGKQARTMAEMRHLADLLEKYQTLYHRYPRSTTMAELEMQLKGLAQQQLNEKWLPKLKLPVDLPTAAPEPPPESTPKPPPRMPPVSSPARPTGDIDPLNRSLGQQLPDRSCAPKRDPLTGEPIYGEEYQVNCPSYPASTAGEGTAPALRGRQSPGSDEAQPENDNLPQEAPDGPLTPTGPPIILGKMDFAKLPQQDNWGNDYHYLAIGQDYILASAGSDGRLEHQDISQYGPKILQRHSQDLVIRTGKWIQAPDKAPK